MDEQVYNNIAKELSGEATSAELRQLKEWLHTDPGNKALYEDIKSYWGRADEAAAMPEFDTKAAWAKVSGRLGIEEKGTRTISFPSWAKYSVAAAAVLMIGFFVANNFWGNTDVVVAANGENMEVTLPDNSHVILRDGSVLRYPKAFKGSTRQVALEGEAFFDVARNEQQPFVIDAQAARVQVLGTSFDVNCTDEQATVTVKTGKVQMSDRKTAASVILTPGEKGLLKSGRLSEEAVKTDNMLYWQTGKMVYTEALLADIAKELSEMKDTAIIIDPAMPQELRNQLINITFTNQPLSEILTDLCLVAQCEWSKKDDTYHIRGK